VALCASAFLNGAIKQYYYPGLVFPPTSVLFMLVNVALIFLWFRLDSNAIGYRRAPWLSIAVIAIPIITLPYYFFRSRGTKRGAIATGLMLLAIPAAGVLATTGALLAYHGLQS